MAHHEVIHVWRNLHLADAAVCDALNTRLAREAGCSLIEHDLLAWLAAAQGNRLRMRDLADRLRVTPGGLTRIVDRLVRRGWIDRESPLGNRREVYAMLTPAGATALGNARATYSRVLQESLTKHLDERELHILGEIAHKLLRGIDARHEHHCPSSAR